MAVITINEKLNVALLLDGDAASRAADINRRLWERGATSINFDTDERTSIPHVTVAMGDAPIRKRNELGDAARRAVQNGPHLNVIFGQPYRETVTGRYIFSDVIGTPETLRWLSAARRVFAPFFVSLARMSDVPHLTLGHFDDASSQIDQMLKKESPLPHCEVKEIAIARAGPKGTLRHAYFRIPVNKGGR